MVALAESVALVESPRWPLLDTLDAERLLECLAGDHLHRLLRDATLYQLTIGPRHALLARLIVTCDPLHLPAAVARASETDEVGVNLIAQWLARTAPALVRARRAELQERTADSCESATRRAAMSRTGRTDAAVMVDAASRAFDLPLLDFLADLVSSLPSGRVVVSVTDLGGIAGCADRGTIDHPATISLDRAACSNRTDRERIWAHEVAHLCDHDIETIAPELAEQFADDLGAWLERTQPATVADVRAEISTYDRRRRLWVRGTGRHALPEPGLDSHLAFAFLRLDSRAG